MSDLRKTEQGFFMRSCPKCGGHKLKVHDCGYSSFNCGGVKCVCGYELKLNSLGCFPNDEIVSAWNTHAKTLKKLEAEDRKKAEANDLSQECKQWIEKWNETATAALHFYLPKEQHVIQCRQELKAIAGKLK